MEGKNYICMFNNKSVCIGDKAAWIKNIAQQTGLQEQSRELNKF